MRLNITIEVWKKRNWFIAKCPELDFISQGKTHEEAKENLLEVIRIQFKEMAGLGTLDEYLGECGLVREGDEMTALSEMVGMEKYSLQVA
jgi:predicted RNase H-like HicB family nuclease